MDCAATRFLVVVNWVTFVVDCVQEMRGEALGAPIRIFSQAVFRLGNHVAGVQIIDLIPLLTL